jgi:phosphoribosyl-ATP pyrophosphohydrolase/phosphoribosyl-AMP cyclohydrolase
MSVKIEQVDWTKLGGLVPAVVQDAHSARVLMLGYMNAEALAQTQRDGEVTFYSRSRERLWRKGETSGHVLRVRAMHLDCDQDAVLILAEPAGPTCHLGCVSCFGEHAVAQATELAELDALIAQRAHSRPAGSYTTRLLEEGTRRVAQKVGEEAVETALAAVAQDERALLDESADLVFHLLVLLRSRGLGLPELLASLRARRAR